jgi:hypothetical protein
LDPAKLTERANRQGLAKTERASAADVLARVGWIPSAGGHLPSLSFWRRAGIAPAAIAKEIEKGRIAEVTTVRRTAMLVPEADVAIALVLGGAAFERDVAMPLGKTAKLRKSELITLERPVLTALEKGPAKESALGERPQLRGKFRDLGEAGRAKGLTSTLTATLAWLEGRGLVARRPEAGRIVKPEHVWELSDRHEAVGAIHETQALAELAARFAQWHGPIDPAHLAAFAGIGSRLAHELALKTTPPKKLRGSAVPAMLLSFRDPFTALLAPAELTRALDAVGLSWSNEVRALRELPTLQQHTVHAGAELVGFWEWDDEKKAIVWDVLRDAKGKPVAKLPKATVDAIEKDAERLATFVKAELEGSLRYAADADHAHGERLAFVRKHRR